MTHKLTEVQKYFSERVISMFGLNQQKSLDKIDAMIQQKTPDPNPNGQALEDYLKDGSEAEHLFIIKSGENLGFLSEPPAPEKFKGKSGIMSIRLIKDNLDLENIQQGIIFFELSPNILNHCYVMFHDVMAPVLQNPQNQVGYTDLVTKDLMEKFNNYIAQIYVMLGLIKGRTMLPMPSSKLTSNETTPDKDKAHIFESSIITWTKQIKNVLKLEPEQALKLGNDPGPTTELTFWDNKSQNLNSIWEQLSSTEVKNILKFLEKNKSTYTGPFNKLQRDVQLARIEANDNSRYLKSLQSLFESLEDNGKDFMTTHDLFIPIMHTILLIWQNSQYYNSPPRLVVLIREICNAIISKAREFASGQTIFTLIQSDETQEAYQKLSITIDICTKFKDAYFEYKAKANQQWKLTTNALFVKLDSFLERAHDILHLTKTIVEFNKLERIDLGGTKGKTLTESVKQIFNEFKDAVAAFQQVKYDIMDIEKKEFDDDFYEFRAKIKELERRLASVITQGFDDCDTIIGRFKLLDSFEGLLNRPIIQDELEKKHIVLLENYKQDLKLVQSIFLEGKQLIDSADFEKSPIYINMPPIAGALSWCKGLKERMKEPLDKLTNLGQTICEREEYKDVQKLHTSINKAIHEYEQVKQASWEKEVEATSVEKLEQPLLNKDENGLLRVNFDAALVRLLREVRYFQQLNLNVPDSAKNIFAKVDIYRVQTVSLELIVNNYNQIITCLHPVEEPLIKDRIEKMDKTIQPALDEIKWKSDKISNFISTCKEIVDSTFEVVQKMKDAIDKVKGCLEAINKPVVEKKNKPLSPEDFQQIHLAVFSAKTQNVKENGTAIHKLIKEVNDAIKIDKKSPIWKAYVDYVNEIVLMGISTAIMTALKSLNEQIDFNQRKSDAVPIFEIKLELQENSVGYEPPIEQLKDPNRLSVINSVNGWISDFYQYSFFITRLDKSEPSDYLQELRDYFELKEVLALISGNLEQIEKEGKSFIEQFSKYSYLWLEDPNETFEKFLIDNDPAEDEFLKDDVQQGEDGKEASKIDYKDNPLLNGVKAKIPYLELFDDKIQALKIVQNEVTKIQTPVDIGWLKISLAPLKASLNAKVVSWVNVYTQFLTTQFKTTLKNLKGFVAETAAGIIRNPADEENQSDKKLLMNVMKVISDVKDVEPRTEGIIKRMKEMINTLKKHSINMQDKGEEEPLQAIDNTYANFKETTQKVFKIKADILPLQTQEAISIKKRLDGFSKQVKDFRANFLQVLPFNYAMGYTIEEINKSYAMIDQYYGKLCDINQEARDFNNLEKLFELEQSEYKALRECQHDLKNLKLMWDAIAMVNYQYKDWQGQSWRRIKADALFESNKILQLQIKNLPREIKSYKGHPVITEEVKNMSVVLPLVSSLHSEFMEQRHWKQLQELTEKTFDQKSNTFCFSDILDLKLFKYEAQVNEIVDVAQKEAKIEKKLKNIESAWTKQNFEFEDYNQTKGFLPLDNMMELLDNHTMDLMGMKSQGKYVEFFLVTVEEWREKLGRSEAVINEWLKVQKNWKVLVNIFLKAEDIKAQLSEETKVFEGVDREFRDMMTDTCANPGVIDACTKERLEQLQVMSASIKRCEKSLNEYLEGKKKAFPRFYFLSNQSLLTILSNGTNPPKVCEFIGDCFDGLQSLVFNPPLPGKEIPNVANGMISKDGEIVNFLQDFTCEGAVENWCTELEFQMRQILYQVLIVAKEASEQWDNSEGMERQNWVFNYNAQIALLCTQIVWTEDVQRAFEDLQGGQEMAMKQAQSVIEGRIEELIKKVRGELPQLERNKIINVITIDVHSRDVVEKFCLTKVQEPESFAWLSQLKFYWENKDQDMASRQNLRFPWEKEKEKMKCIIRIVDWFRFYSFEYTGNSIRLVITPLTDRCYITLTQALNLTMGGAPAGPAGTGKTETTKDLGRGVGIPVVVFNCSDQMNKDSMAQIFMGLSQSGAWGCFDEFNRISIEVLSVVSSQVKCILDALKEKRTKFQFTEEGEIGLIDTVGFFITMNPGYAGRTELPENLKALFRSCAMVTPDLILICENMLLSEGFSTAKNLAKKFVSLYMLSRELLSKARHYDWGLRAVKSVLRQAGKLKRQDPQIPEDPLLMRALRDFNIPKIVTDDKPIFLRLISDLFPRIEQESKMDLELKKLVQKTTKTDMGLIPEEAFALKVVQLQEILGVRHCVFIIGPPGCGKSAVWKALVKTQINQGDDTEYDTVNPKAVTSDELFGSYTKTKEWKNGVLSMFMKNQVKCEEKYVKNQNYKWSVLDGDIDPEWIESLNTVMDDNKVLTLVSNDRIALTPSMRLVFEISNLRNATPATVSRAGVLFINETDIGWMPEMNSWLERTKDKLVDNTRSAIETKLLRKDIDDIGKNVFYRCFQSYIESNPEISKIRHIAPMMDMGMIKALCTMIDQLLIEHEQPMTELNEDAQKIAYEAIFIFAAMWAFGGSVGGGQDDEKDQKEFSSFWRSISKVKFPEGGLCFDYVYDVSKNNWVTWNSLIPEYKPVALEEMSFSQIYVSTLHTTRLDYLLNLHVNRFKPVLFIGSAGTGKTAVTKNYLGNCSTEKVDYRIMNFNSFTDSNALQLSIESMVVKKSGRVFGSASNKTLIYFIDDMNMPFVDKYGTQSPIALLQYIVDYNSVFNREQLEERKFLQDLLFLGSLNPKSGSFVIDARLQRHFTVFTMFTPGQDTIKSIYGSILGGHIVPWQDPASDKLTPKIIDATIHIFNKILKDTRYSPSSKKFYYQFNLRDLSKVIEGVMLSQPNHYKGKEQQMVELWVSECKRVFEDRMINFDDINQFRVYLKDAVTKNIDEKYGDSPQNKENLFTSFITVHNGYDKAYIQIKNNAELKVTLEEKLQEHNEQKSIMNLVLFNDAMEHIVRICRILDFPTGSALLVGVGGSGKQSLSKLSAFILGFDVQQIVVTSSYSLNDLKLFLQEIYKKLSKPGSVPCCFLITDSQIKYESFLIPINDILNSGWIADLFPKEDVEAMIGNLRNEAKGNGCADNPDALREYFLQNMKQKMKLILCFSPVGDNFRVKARKFPGLINATSIDYFHPWPKDALIDVANRFIADIEFPEPGLIEKIALNMAEVHSSIDEANVLFLKQARRFNYTTPKSFLELIAFYKNILETKRGSIEMNIQRYDQGLMILAQTQEKVEGLQDDLKVIMVTVAKRREETDALIDMVGKESAIAEVEQDAANIEEDQTNAQAAAAEELKQQAETALGEALPALQKAKDAVAGMNKGHITEMKNLGQPPRMVVHTGKVVLTLLGEKINQNDPDDKIWKKCATTMNNPIKFIELIQNFNGEQIEQSILDNCAKLCEDPEYNVETMKSKNYAAMILCSWSINIIIFNKIFKMVKPLVESKNAAIEQVAIKMKDLAIVKEKVRVLNEKVAALKNQLAEAEATKQAVEAEAASCEAKLNAAVKLVNGLSGENTRWKQTVKNLRQETKWVVGDCLLASAFVSYIGAFNIKFRLNLWQNTWLPDITNKQIPMTANITPLKILTTDSKMAQWKNEGLPADQMSLENATVITSASRWPLIIDPQLQGSIWLRGSLGENLLVLNPNQNKWLNKLIEAIQNGKYVLLEGIQQEIDATLDPLLNKAIKKSGKNYQLELGGDPIDYDPNFKLYLMTKLFNPHFRPEIAAQCTIINMIVTESGLEEQLLASVVNNEKAELEQTKQELVKKQNQFQVTLNTLEEELLQTLAEADPATILENKELIDKLDITKQTSNEIAIQQEQAKITEIEINASRELYRSVAAEGAMLYFLCIQLNIVDHMYQYSLDSFYKFFFKAIYKVAVQDETRIEELIKQIRFTICQWIMRGLFERHKLIWLTLLTFRLMQKKNIDITYEQAQMDFLVKGMTKPGTENPLDWLPQLAWDSVQALIGLPDFGSFAQNMEKDAPNRFKDWYNELLPEEQKLPLDWKKLDNMPFQKLLVLRCLRPDRITIALGNFIRNVLPYGSEYTDMDQKSTFTEILEQAFDDSDPNTPIFFILSPGADPVKEVEKICKKRKMEPGKTFFTMALGQGQDEIAKRRIEEGNKEGHWVMLENIHLMPVWLLELEKILDAYSAESGAGNPVFRLLLSADPSKGIPIGILDRSIKLTNEPPAGLKANMKRAWTYFSKEEVEEKDVKVKSILFALCFFHSTLLERRTFGPKGWNMKYPFSIGDLRDSSLVLNKYMENNPGGKVPFDDLIYIFGEIMYGGHIVDDWDRRLTLNYLYNIMNDQLFDELELFPYIEGKGLSFKVPGPNVYEKYLEHIDTCLQNETPLAYGLHSNTEIGFRTTQCSDMFEQLYELMPKDTEVASGSEVKTALDIANDTLKYILEEMNMKSMIFNLEDVKTKIDADSKGPYQNVFLQELEYMNILLSEICRSLDDINQGIQGLLTISEKMESIIDAIALNKVPVPWTNLAYPSKRGLGSWLLNLFQRVDQLNLFRDDPLNIPKVIMISRFFNPQSFLTAIKQVVGRKNAYELNKLYIATEVTKKQIEEIDAPGKDGSYVYGFILEGARWDVQLSTLEESKPKEMFSVLPVVYCKAQLMQEVGKEDKSLYQCPAYRTEDRGNTFIFCGQLKTRLPARKWILAGVVMLLDVEGVGEIVKKKEEK